MKNVFKTPNIECMSIPFEDCIMNVTPLLSEERSDPKIIIGDDRIINNEYLMWKSFDYWI